MITLIGVNHRSAPLDMRERLALSEEGGRELLGELTALEGVDEAWVLSTCNRVEYLVRCPERQGVQSLTTFLSQRYALDREALDRHAYQLEGADAVRHLFRVSAGLDSMILGEPQIHGQVKQAFQQAREAGSTGVIVDRLLQYALSTAKRVRTETGISRHAVSVAYAAVSLASKIFDDLKGRRVLMLGAGKMGELVARHMQRHGVTDLEVASRLFTNADRAARRFGGRAVHWEEGIETLAEHDIVVTCTGAPRPILTRDHVAQALRKRRGGPLFLIDIAVPRDIEPAVHELDQVYLYDIDALEGVVDSNMEERRSAAKQAERMIEVEVKGFNRWRQSQGIAPLIRSLREGFFAVEAREFERVRSRLGDLDEAQLEALREYARATVKKLLHAPTRFLHSAADRGEADRVAELFIELFDIELGVERRGPQRLVRGGKDDA